MTVGFARCSITLIVTFYLRNTLEMRESLKKFFVDYEKRAGQYSLVAKRVNRIDAGGLEGRVRAEKDAHHDGNTERHHN
jgi:hypothetical protein